MVHVSAHVAGRSLELAGRKTGSDAQRLGLMAGNAALYLALRLGIWLLPHVPLSVAYGLATAAGTLAYYLFPLPRRGICQNLAVVMDTSPSSRDVRRAARRAFQCDAKNWIDTIRIGRLSDEQILAAVEVDGWERLDAALEAERGLILVTLHLGNFDLVGQALAARGYRVTVPVERMHPERLFRLLQRERRSKGINAVPVEAAVRDMLRTLKAGNIVAVAGDRRVAGRGIEVEFFGKPAVLPRGPVAVARHTGAPLLVGVGVRLPHNRFAGHVSQPIRIERTASAERDDRVNARRLAEVMEGYIRRHPDQWLVFSSLWSRGGAPDQPATIGQQKEAAV